MIDVAEYYPAIEPPDVGFFGYVIGTPDDEELRASGGYSWEQLFFGEEIWAQLLASGLPQRFPAPMGVVLILESGAAEYIPAPREAHLARPCGCSFASAALQPLLAVIDDGIGSAVGDTRRFLEDLRIFVGACIARRSTLDLVVTA